MENDNVLGVERHFRFVENDEFWSEHEDLSGEILNAISAGKAGEKKTPIRIGIDSDNSKTLRNDPNLGLFFRNFDFWTQVGRPEALPMTSIWWRHDGWRLGRRRRSTTTCKIFGSYRLGNYCWPPKSKPKFEKEAFLLKHSTINGPTFIEKIAFKKKPTGAKNKNTHTQIHKKRSALILTHGINNRLSASSDSTPDEHHDNLGGSLTVKISVTSTPLVHTVHTKNRRKKSRANGGHPPRAFPSGKSQLLYDTLRIHSTLAS